MFKGDPYSHPHDPKTWGENAIICDPWSNTVYQASDYLSNLKNYFDSNNKNYTENFDPKKHYINNKDYRACNSNYILKNRNIESLKENFSKSCTHLCRIIESYARKLHEEEKRLINKNEDDPKAKIISSKLQKLWPLSLEVNFKAKDIINNDNNVTDYRETRINLLKEISILKGQIISSMKFTKEELETLYAHSAPNKVINLFKMKPKTQKNLEQLTEITNKKFNF